MWQIYYLAFGKIHQVRASCLSHLAWGWSMRRLNSYFRYTLDTCSIYIFVFCKKLVVTFLLSASLVYTLKNIFLAGFWSLANNWLCHCPPGNYMFKFNNRNTRIRCEICSKLTIKTPGVVYFEHISHLVLRFLLLTLSRWMPVGWEQLLT